MCHTCIPSLTDDKRRWNRQKHQHNIHTLLQQMNGAFSVQNDVFCMHTILSLQWRLNESDDVPNHRVPIVYWTVCSGVVQRKHQSFTSLAVVRGIHRSPVNSPHTGPVTRQMFSFDDVIMSSPNTESVQAVQIRPRGWQRPVYPTCVITVNSLI